MSAPVTLFYSATSKANPHPSSEGEPKTKGMFDNQNEWARSGIMATRGYTVPITRKGTHGLLKTIEPIDRHSQHGLQDNKREQSKIKLYIKQHTTQIMHKILSEQYI